MVVVWRPSYASTDAGQRQQHHTATCASAVSFQSRPTSNASPERRQRRTGKHQGARGKQRLRHAGLLRCLCPHHGSGRARRALRNGRPDTQLPRSSNPRRCSRVRPGGERACDVACAAPYRRHQRLPARVFRARSAARIHLNVFAGSSWPTGSAMLVRGRPRGRPRRRPRAAPHLAHVLEERLGATIVRRRVAWNGPGPEDRADLLVGDRGRRRAPRRPCSPTERPIRSRRRLNARSSTWKSTSTACAGAAAASTAALPGLSAGARELPRAAQPRH